MPDRLVRVPLVGGGEVAFRPDDVLLVRTYRLNQQDADGQCWLVLVDSREHVALTVSETVAAINGAAADL